MKQEINKGRCLTVDYFPLLVSLAALLLLFIINFMLAIKVMGFSTSFQQLAVVTYHPNSVLSPLPLLVPLVW